MINEWNETKKIFRPIDNQFRTPTLVDDLALAINEIAIRSATGMYHIAGNDFMSIIELSEKVEKDKINLQNSLFEIGKFIQSALDTINISDEELDVAA